MRITLSLLMLAWTVACSSPAPVRPAAIESPSLQRIQTKFESTIAAAHADPDVEWKSGWTGNLAVTLGSEKRGLCYEWQGLVHAGVRRAVVTEGWELLGISINRHTTNEHHAVIVWDPADRLTKANVLDARSDQQAWVLDAWQNGRAEIWHVRDWVRLPFLVRVDPILETPFGAAAESER